MLTATLTSQQRQDLIDGLDVLGLMTDQGTEVNVRQGYVQHVEGQDWLADGGTITILPRAPEENLLEEVQVTI